LTDILLNLDGVITDDDTSKIIFTYSDLLKLFDWPKNIQIEIIKGELFRPPLRSLYHHEITARLNFLLRGYSFNKKLGSIFPTPIEVVLSKENVVLPALFFVSGVRKDIIDKNRVMGAPEMIIEVFENNLSQYAKLKKSLYEQFGVQELVSINSKKKTVKHFLLKQKTGTKAKKYTVYSTYKETDTLEIQSIAGLEINLKDIFYSNINL
jgi:hypothetical protein